MPNSPPAPRAKNVVTDQRDKPVLDQQTFEKLLEAAHVLQEHNRKLRDLEAIVESERRREREAADEPHRPIPRADAPEGERKDGDYTLTLAEIVEAQRQIQMRHLALDETMAVVAERVTHITGGTGAGIGILDGKKVRYRAGTGAPALPLGSEVPLKTAICAASVRTGQVIRSEDVNTEVLFDPEPCRQRGILSLLAVPIYQDGGIVGGLELYFDKIHGYAEQDIHTCQLMAGLLTEALSREAEQNLKKSMAVERSSMLAEIEKLQPAPSNGEKNAPVPSVPSVSESARHAVSPCARCGNELTAEELFCGRCGTPHATDEKLIHLGNIPDLLLPLNSGTKIGTDSPDGVAEEGHPADSLHANQTDFNREPASPELNAVHSNAVHSNAVHFDVHYEAHYDDAPAEFPFASPELPERDRHEPVPASSLAASASGGSARSQTPGPAPSDSKLAKLPEDGPASAETESTALAGPQSEEVVWTSAARAREFLESLTIGRTPGAFARFWRSRRGDFYLAIAVVLVAIVVRWGIWSDQPAGAASSGPAVSASHRKADADADLSMFDKLLISLGLAEEPEAPEYKGNPDTEVWLDLQTALYYCPGSDLYGKTAKGRLATQRDAQLDQFEPAYRKACK